LSLARSDVITVEKTGKVKPGPDISGPGLYSYDLYVPALAEPVV